MNSDSDNHTAVKTAHQKVGAIAVVGGTHGNELTGVHLVNHWRSKQNNENFISSKFPEFQIETLLANEPAVEENKRYLQKDLNRCFKLEELNDPEQTLAEQKLAKKINFELGPKGESRVDFIVDLHTSTANMQTNIVLIKMDYFHLHLAAYIKQQIPDAVITSESRLMDDHHFLCSIAPKGVVIEVGPIAQGSLDWDIFNKTENALNAVLEFVKVFNQGQVDSLQLDNELEVMSYFNKLYFPTDESDEITATVHPSLIHQDYSKIVNGSSIFKSFDGEDILYDGPDAHVAFINEAAYYDQKIAMCLCNPLSYSLETLQPIEK